MATDNNRHLVVITDVVSEHASGELPSGEGVAFSLKGTEIIADMAGCTVDKIIGYVISGRILPNMYESSREAQPWFCHRVESLAAKGDFNRVRRDLQRTADVLPKSNVVLTPGQQDIRKGKVKYFPPNLLIDLSVL